MTVVGSPDRAPNDRQATWRGFGDGLSQAVEMAVTPVLCALIGLFVDRRVGTCLALRGCPAAKGEAPPMVPVGHLVRSALVIAPLVLVVAGIGRGGRRRECRLRSGPGRRRGQGGPGSGRHPYRYRRPALSRGGGILSLGGGMW